MSGYAAQPRPGRSFSCRSPRFKIRGALARAVMQEPEAAIIVNADDWGADAATTRRILECVRAGVVSSASAMVFMEGSEQAAELARVHGVDTGLHLNLTQEFSGLGCPARVKEHQARIRRFLCFHALAPAIYHPGLRASFEYVVRAQIEEYERLYGHAPGRIDGHHHMHLCANVLFDKLLPAGVMVRREFTFRRGEKSFLNRAFRNFRNRLLARRYRLADCFFNLAPVQPGARLERIFALAAHANVELETHPVNEEEYRFLRGREFERFAGGVSIRRGYVLRGFEPSMLGESTT